MNNTTFSRTDLNRNKLIHQEESPAMLAFYIAFFVVGVIENSLVLVIIFKKKERKTANEIFIANLTISDLSFITFSSTLSISMYFVQRYASIFVCKFVYPMITATFFVSIATVASMAVQRCYAILNPFKPRIKRRSLIMWQVAIWLLSFLIVTPQSIVTNVSQTWTCYEEWSSQTYAKLYTVFLFILQYIFPLTVISVSYIKIGMYVSKSNLKSRQLGTNTLNNQRVRDEMAVKRTIIIILVVFLLCMLPNQVAYFLLDFGSVDQRRAAETLLQYVDIPTFLHSCVNPIIYGALFRQFREGYVRYLSHIMRFFCCKSCNQKRRHHAEDAFADEDLVRQNRGLRLGEHPRDDQLVMEEDYEERRRNERGRGQVPGEESSRIVVMESNV
ncbi:hypothetical protein OS493_005228 [Desmophyllum pertusum]|uniref:G-protein coupled receptors family 1 profile domain-containing protein n=1 Tax=Desmophyllum pertusum TaxID=174260 RepID=A0A9W9Z4P4_9CNID|nr:hypothetical protein OS493_005228 [Desmophyllum pertusum]